MLFLVSYLVISFLFPKNIEMESIMHSLISAFWSWYIFKMYIPIYLFSYESLNNFVDYIEYNPIIKFNLLKLTKHSIEYYIADTVNICIAQDKRKKYILHHIISVIGLSSIFLDTYIGSYAIFLNAPAVIGHHTKRLFENIKNKHLKLVVFIFYFFSYSISRILMSINIIHYSFHIKKYQDIIPIFITYPLVFQNFIWLYKNFLKLKNY